MKTPLDDSLDSFYEALFPNGEPLNQDGQHDSATPGDYEGSNDAVGWDELVEQHRRETPR
ncbi:MAG: hypothetical protein EA370_13210 [Wenzhouxiangella sp.]|nr:MAG: hypothetical protein EA370_13210 [Wenzhouxiangella sp.]